MTATGLMGSKAPDGSDRATQDAILQSGGSTGG